MLSSQEPGSACCRRKNDFFFWHPSQDDRVKVLSTREEGLWKRDTFCQSSHYISWPS